MVGVNDDDNCLHAFQYLGMTQTLPHGLTSCDEVRISPERFQWPWRRLVPAEAGHIVSKEMCEYG